MTLKLTKQEKFWGWFYLLAQMLVLPFAVALIFVWLGIYSDTAINNVCFFLNGALAVLVFRHLLEQSFRNRRGRWKQTVLTALKGLGLHWMLSIAMSMVIFQIDPNFGNVNDANVGTMLTESPLLMTIAVIFVAPLAEECLFRGWIFTGLAQRNLPLAYGVTACFFSAAHILGYVGRYDPLTLLLCFLQYLGPSIALCFTCLKADSLLAPMLLHMTINAIALILTR